MYECCLHRNSMHALPAAAFASLRTLLGTKAANSKNGWESSMIPIVPNLSAQLSGRWQTPAQPQGWGLSVKNAQVVFLHRWRLLKATKPPGY
jgi:hypothetical protein